ISEIQPSAFAKGPRDTLDSVTVQEATCHANAVERETAAGPCQLEEDHQLEAGVQFALGEERTDQPKSRKHRASELEALQSLRIDVPDESLTDLVREPGLTID